MYEEVFESIRRNLDDAGFDGAREKGRRLTVDEAVALAVDVLH